ncbi:MAG: protein kinase [Pyrinomonadaceae bacterium]
MARNFGLDFFEDRPCLVREFVPGRPLTEYARRDALTLRGLLKIAHDSAAALHAVHRRGYTHEDLSPDKLIITPGGDVKIVDLGFGYFKRLARYLAERQPDEFKLEEFEPEGYFAAARAADLLALGRALYFAVTGQFPPAAEGVSFKRPLLGPERPSRSRTGASGARSGSSSRSARRTWT